MDFDESTKVTPKKAARWGFIATAGIIVGAAWILLVDGTIYETRNNLNPKFEWYWYFPTVVATLGLIMTNMVDFSLLEPDSWMYGDSINQRVRAWLFFSFIVTFCGVGGCIWIMVERFETHKELLDPDSEFCGITILLSGVFTMFGSLLFVLGKSIKSESEEEAGIL